MPARRERAPLSLSTCCSWPPCNTRACAGFKVRVGDWGRVGVRIGIGAGLGFGLGLGLGSGSELGSGSGLGLGLQRARLAEDLEGIGGAGRLVSHEAHGTEGADPEHLSSLEVCEARARVCSPLQLERLAHTLLQQSAE